MYQLYTYVPIIIAPPSQPIGLTTTSIQSTTVTITWSQPSDTGGRSDIFYTIMIEGDGMSQTLPSTGNITTYTITDLTPSTNYDITVIAENGVSDQDSDVSDRSDFIMITTSSSGKCMYIDLCVIMTVSMGEPFNSAYFGVFIRSN